MTVCLQYNRPLSGSLEGEIYGFDVAVTNLLSAWFRLGATEKFLCRPGDLDSFDHFKQLAAAAGVDAETRCIGLNPNYPQQNLNGISCLFRPDPLIADLMWRRQQLPGRGFATCGLVHTMSGMRITQAVSDLCLAPSDETDALICPSHAIRDAVRRLWEINADYLNHRFGGAFTSPIQTPVIPLGIDSDKFAALTTPEKRAAQRAALGVAEDEIVVLFVGRLSFATKAHPLPLFIAAERAARRTGKKVRLVMFGYFKPQDMEPRFRALAADICKTVRVDFVMNGDTRFPDGLWAAGDIFASLSDNVQESFGLTPIEAMACGLPAVVTDWDGYRDGVRNGVDGFLIPTLTPPPAAGQAIAEMYYNQDNYGVALTATSQSTVVDIEWCAQALAVLIENPETRRAYAANGRARARDVFDWRHIIPAYENLWHELSGKRLATPRRTLVPENWPAAHPAYVNPWHMFASFPTTHLNADDIIGILMDDNDIDMILSHDMNYFVPDMLLPKTQIKELAGVIRRAQSARIGDILAPFPLDQHSILWRCVGWMLKHGVCAYQRPAQGASA